VNQGICKEMPNENSKTITFDTFAGQGAHWQQQLGVSVRMAPLLI
jgi:hypothetical protein